jgi:serine/threonine protein phosphatase 1
MLHSLRKLWSPVTEVRPPPVVPPDQRVYAIGDIHGRLDLMAAMIGAVEADDRARSAADTTVVLLGDLVDRGPHSSGVLRAARIWQERRNLRLLRGNHEDMFLESLEDLQVFRSFLQYGGRETVLSYRVDATAFEEAEPEEAQAMMIAAVPREDIEFIAEFEDFVVIGDYLFVHAGIRPGRPLLDQSPQEMRWIREPFLSHLDYHEHVVVHGHTIVDEPEIYHNRIGIDTGAYMSGRLTALALEADQRWLIEAEKMPSGKIAIASRPIPPDEERATNMPGDL